MGIFIIAIGYMLYTSPIGGDGSYHQIKQERMAVERERAKQVVLLMNQMEKEGVLITNDKTAN